MNRGRLCINCTDSITGEIGSFLAEMDGHPFKAISPVFDGSYRLFLWLMDNGWIRENYNPAFPTGTYVKKSDEASIL